MYQTQPSQKQTPMNIVYWSLAFDPAFLALIALFLNMQGAVGQLQGFPIEKYLSVIFSILGLTAAWFSFKIMAPVSRIIPLPVKTNDPASGRKLIVALSLVIVPGILGFVLYFLFGNICYLIAFNGGAVGLAIKHITKFNEGSSSLS